MLEDPVIILKAGETAYMDFDAVLLKETVLCERQGQHVGVSVRVARGVRLGFGQSRGRTVNVGSYMVVVDQGTLTITSRRLVFTGAMQSMEILLSKLMSLEVFNDGVKFHVANRVNAPLFRVTAGFGDLVGALVTAAAQPPDPVPN